MWRNHVDSWLVFLAKPDAIELSAQRMKRLSTEDLGRLGESAGGHGVLPAVLTNLEKLSRLEHYRDLIPPSQTCAAALEKSKKDLRLVAGLSLMLRLHLPPILDALRAHSVPAAVLRGPEFADRLYPVPELRPFTDLDILIPREMAHAAGEALSKLGYVHKTLGGLRHEAVYGEELWKHPNWPAEQVEIHWNLVNSPAVQAGVSVELDDLQFEPGPDSTRRLTPAAMLLMAAVHGASSHSFDRLQIMCDVRQILRGAAGVVDEDYLEKAAGETGATLSLYTAMRLAQRLFGDTECGALTRRLASRCKSWLSRLAISPHVVLHSETTTNQNRRRCFRQLLKSR